MKKFHKCKNYFQNSFLFQKIALLLRAFNLIPAMHIYSFLLTPRYLVLTIFLFVGTLTNLQSQSSSPFRRLQTSKNISVSDTLVGVTFAVNVINNGSNGLATKTLLPNNNVKINYQPNAGFVGVDTFILELNYSPGTFPFLSYQAYIVNVLPSIIIPRSDFAITSISTPITFNVLNNDNGSNLPLTLSQIPLVNHGLVVFNANGSVTFTPESGYSGIAHFNYVVCDALGNCKTSSADISVSSSSIPSALPMRLATAKNTALTAPLSHNNYTLFTAPTNGILTLLPGHIFKYEPQFNFTGVDSFLLSNNSTGNTIFRSVLIDVLNTPTQNSMAMEDYVHTPKNQAVIFNVSDNDIGNLSVKGVTIAANNFPGTLDYWYANGQMKFTPNPGFSGVVQFKYKIGNSQFPNVESATVNVLVGNMAPSQGTFDLTTPVETPLVINYQIPFLGFDFAVLDQPDNGILEIKQGFWSGIVNGQNISGYNLLLFTPYTGFVGEDQFELNYCVTATNQCQIVKINVNVTDVTTGAAPYCVNGCVWAGDINNDGIVNAKDLLPLGYFMGLDGSIRPDASLEWYPQYSPNWANPFSGLPIDVKHADTNGDGDITTIDTAAIVAFYGQTHTITPTVIPTSKGLPFFLTLLTPNPGIGDLVEVEVALGKASIPVTNIYGFTYDVNLSRQIVDSAFHMNFYDNVWTNFNAPTLNIQKRVRKGRLETAFTRTNGVAASGYGKIGKFSYIIVDVIDGGKPGEAPVALVSLEGVQTLMADGSLVSYEGTTLEIPLNIHRNDTPTVAVNESDLFVYPSPATDLVQVHLNGNNLIENLSILSIAGNMVWNSGKVEWKHAEMNLGGLPNGVYFAVAHTAAGRVTKKFEIIR
jgi:Cadherin-like domain/Secretion system C-terminal sorting domain/Dockerin type I domain